MIKKILVFLLVSSTIFAGDFFKEPFENGVFIVDGDIPAEKIESHFKDHSKSKFNYLIVNKLLSGAIDLWNEKDAQQLTYCISNKFKDRKQLVIETVAEATQAWMNEANVKFIYVSSEDANCDEYNKNVLFDIRPVNIGGRYLARAFFPSSKREIRNILIDNSSFRYKYDSLVGFLTHEFGHVLGFRHEHIHMKSKRMCEEDSNFLPLTEYDKKSVMHYPQCGGLGNIERLTLSDIDRDGARLAYPF